MTAARPSFDPAPDDRRLLGSSDEPTTAAARWLHDLNRGGWVEATDVHVARRVGRLVAEDDPLVSVTLALAVRAVREGSTCLDLAEAGELLQAASGQPDDADQQGDVDREVPPPSAWRERLEISRTCAAEVLQVQHGLVYLDRYWREEQQVVADLRARAQVTPQPVDEALLDEGLARVFPGETWAEQRDAVRAAAARPTTILTGGPGTGKTSTVAGLITLLAEQHEHRGGATAAATRPLSVVLAAPTGKAAARLRESVLDAAEAMGEVDRARLATLGSSTVHRLLGWTPSATRFRRHRGNPLPHDLVVVDEASMLSLTLTARLLEAVRPTSRLVLVGDPDQLASVEAGAVLADLVAGSAGAPSSPVVSLRTSHRFGATIGTLASAVRDGDTETALSALRDGGPEVEWVVLPEPPDATTTEDEGGAAANDAAAAPRTSSSAPDRPGTAAADRTGAAAADRATRARAAAAEEAIRPVVLGHALALRELAIAGDVPGAIDQLAEHRLLLAHRDGPWGVNAWNGRVERWVADVTQVPSWSGHGVGRPLLVTRNDSGLGLFNGDTGVIVATSDGQLVGAFDTAGGTARHAVSRLSDVETAYATTVHKSQGSQARAVTIVLPDADSRLLSRELLYTAITRARERVVLVATESAVRAALEQPTQRASGLAHSLRATGG